MRHVQLVAVGSQQDLEGWRQLELALRKALKEMPVPANPRGFSFVFIGLLIVVLIGYLMASQRLAVAQALEHLLGR